ncbi:MAG: hypothetical protein HQ507_04225 [Candidatus Marinimicrobia bacterium]|nr:hypothetical protein [Candidatus Neomarinimicrobiota bacterium]
MRFERQNLKKITILILLGSLFLGCSGMHAGKDFAFIKVNRADLISKATRAYQAGDYAQAAENFKKVLMHNQDDATTAYNLACCYALQGDAQNTVIFIDHAYANGFRNMELLATDTDLNPVREDPEFAALMHKLEQNFKSLGLLDYVAAPSLFPYRIRFPKGYDASKSYPLLIGMHGAGGSAEGFITHYDKLDNPQVIYVTPEGQYPFTMDMGPQGHNRSWSLTNVGRTAWKMADKMVSEYILNTIKQVSSEYKISDVYLVGFSQGGVYAYTIGLKNPDKINGVIVFGGYLMDVDGEDSVLHKEDLEKGKKLRIYIAHGVDDASIGIKVARDLKTMFEMQGYDVTYTEFEGQHGVNAAVFNDVLKWMQL